MSAETHAPGVDRWRLQAWLRVDASVKPKVYEQVFAATEITSLSYWLEIFFSAGIATFGLVENSPAVIIGGMLISPLMGPIMATGLALAVGDLYLGIKAVINLLISVAVSIGFSAFLVWLLPFHSATSEILARTNPNLLDLGIALLSGLAGSVVVCRGGGDGVTALPGVAIAVALMPPLCAMGFGMGSGLNMEIMSGAGLLFVTNLVAIVASAFLVFLLVGMNTADVQRAMLAARGEAASARMHSHGLVERMLASGGQLHWRVLMIVVLLGSIAVPLRKALLQVASETHARAEVQKALKGLVPADAIVSQQVSIANGEIVIRLISTRYIPNSKVAQVRQELTRQTGQEVQISIDAVASRGELAELRARLERPASIIPRENTVGETQKELLDKVRPVIQELWPSDAPIQDFDVVLGTAGITIEVRYQGAQDLEAAAISMVLQGLQTRLEMPDLRLTASRTPPAITASSPVKATKKRKRK